MYSRVPGRPDSKFCYVLSTLKLTKRAVKAYLNSRVIQLSFCFRDISVKGTALTKLFWCTYADAMIRVRSNKLHKSSLAQWEYLSNPWNTGHESRIHRSVFFRVKKHNVHEAHGKAFCKRYWLLNSKVHFTKAHFDDFRISKKQERKEKTWF